MYKYNIRDDQSVNTSDVHFEGELPNLMTINFPHYTVFPYEMSCYQNAATQYSSDPYYFPTSHMNRLGAISAVFF